MLSLAFTLFGADVSWLELVAFVFALGCVSCNVIELHWGWPLAIVASVLYAWLFFSSRLYGDVAVQAFFFGSSIWGWHRWLLGGGTESAPTRLRVARLSGLQRAAVALGWLALWPAFGALLARFTDSDVPYFNALPTVGSGIAQVLLALKYVETWPVWVVVNVVSTVLYASKQLWLTSLLYVIFAGLALTGWRRWQRKLP
ncbi:MAG: nicotinamide mononucleotide transporter [Proteobacteria bacterium]|nr:nicotinamide mononucleotide transporter [Pseudomonadota bacterium]